MKKIILALVVASISAVSIPSFSADWLYQLEQTRRFQKIAAEKRAAKERELEASKSGRASKPDSAEKRGTISGESRK